MGATWAQVPIRLKINSSNIPIHYSGVARVTGARGAKLNFAPPPLKNIL